MSSGNKILNLLSSNTLEKLYDGHSEGILLVLDKRVISGGLIEIHVINRIIPSNKPITLFGAPKTHPPGFRALRKVSNDTVGTLAFK